MSTANSFCSSWALISVVLDNHIIQLKLSLLTLLFKFLTVHKRCVTDIIKNIPYLIS